MNNKHGRFTAETEKTLKELMDSMLVTKHHGPTNVIMGIYTVGKKARLVIAEREGFTPQLHFNNFGKFYYYTEPGIDRLCMAISLSPDGNITQEIATPELSSKVYMTLSKIWPTTIINDDMVTDTDSYYDDIRYESLQFYTDGLTPERGSFI